VETPHASSGTYKVPLYLHFLNAEMAPNRTLCNHSSNNPDSIIMCFHLFTQTLPKAGLPHRVSVHRPNSPRTCTAPVSFRSLSPFQHPKVARYSSTKSDLQLSYRCTAYSIPRPGNAVLQPCCQGLDLKRCALRSEALCLEIPSSHTPYSCNNRSTITPLVQPYHGSVTSATRPTKNPKIPNLI